MLGIDRSGRLRAYYGDGAGRIGADQIIDADWGTPGVLQFPMGDFTGDGYADLGIVTAGGSFLIAKGDGSGFTAPVLLASQWGVFDVVVSALDWDGDGKVDVIGRTRGGDLWLYRGDGAGGWASKNGTLLATGWGNSRPIPVGDFDGDGHDDLVALQTDGTLWLYRGDGAGGWASKNGSRIGHGWGAFVSVFSPGDFDGEPGTDLLARATDGSLYLYSGTRTGLSSAVRIDSGWQTFSAIF